MMLSNELYVYILCASSCVNPRVYMCVQCADISFIQLPFAVARVMASARCGLATWHHGRSRSKTIIIHYDYYYHCCGYSVHHAIVYEHGLSLSLTHWARHGQPEMPETMKHRRQMK